MTWKRHGMAILVTLLCAGLPGFGAARKHPKRARHIAASPQSAAKRKPSPKREASPKRKNVARPEPAPRRLVLQSSSALVLDQRTGEALVAKQPEAVLPIASITKLMSAMVVLDAKLNPDESLRIERADVDELRHSKSRLPVDTVLSRSEALLLALMSSENRAAHALGRTYPGGLGAFVAAMNAKAKALGLQETRFEDPAGLSGGNVSSARDLAKLVNAAYLYPRIRECTTCPETEIVSGHRRLRFGNTNALIHNPRWNIGLSKTGYIEESGRCLVMQAQLSQRPVLIVLLDSWGKNTRLGDANRIRQWMEGPDPAPRRHRG